MATVDSFRRKLDDKRRLSIPTEVRDEFESGVVITRGFQQYLHLYSQAVWDQRVEPELRGNILDERTSDLNVQFRDGKIEATLDSKQGRLTLEQQHLDYAGIKKNVKVIRAGEFWRIAADD